MKKKIVSLLLAGIMTITSVPQNVLAVEFGTGIEEESIGEFSDGFSEFEENENQVDEEINTGVEDANEFISMGNTFLEAPEEIILDEKLLLDEEIFSAQVSEELVTPLLEDWIWEYDKYLKEYIVLKDYIGMEKNIYVPDKYGDYKVSLEEAVFGDNENIESVKFASDVSGCMDGTFTGCTNLKRVYNIPSKIMSMDWTFSDCNSLVDVPEIPSGVTYMQETFSGCSSLKNAPEIPLGVTDLDRTFSGCSSLESAPEIPSGVTSMEKTFSDCSSLVSAPEIPFGVTYMRETFSGCSSLESAPEIPSGVMNMVATFEGCSSLVSAPEIPSGVTNMYRTFSNCISLISAPEIPPEVTNMSSTFSDCSSLQNAPEIPFGVTDMSSTFEGCSSLVSAPEIPFGVTDLSWAFSSCSSLQNAPEIPSGVKNMLSTFAGCSSLVSAPEIPSGVTDLSWAFSRCSSLENAPVIPSGVTELVGIFAGCSSLVNAPKIPSGVTNMSFVFSKCSSLENAPEIPFGVTNMEETFLDCSSLESAPDIPARVMNMKETFSGCSSLKNVSKISSEVTDLYRTFSGCSSLESAPEIPSGVTNMMATFEGCSSLKNAPKIPYGVLDMGYAFNECNSLVNAPDIPLSVIDLSGTFADCHSLKGEINIYGSLEQTTDKSYVFVRVAKNGNSLIINYTRDNEAIIDSIIAEKGPESDIVKGKCLDGESDDAISWDYNADNKTLTIKGNADIPDYADASLVPWAKHKNETETVIIETGITSIGKNAFAGFVKLTDIEISETVQLLADFCFDSCSSLTSITIPKSVTKISENAFFMTNKIKIYGYMNSYARIYANTYASNFRFIPLDAYIEQGTDISLTTYLAMSDIAYVGRLKDYVGKGTLTDDMIYKLSTRKEFNYNPKPISNTQILESDKHTWEEIYRQCLSTWQVKATYDYPISGMWAVVFERPDTNQIVVSFRGSQSLRSMDGLNDWFDDDLGMTVYNAFTDQMQDTVQLAKAVVKNNPGKDISFTGHSLGGGLAILAASVTNLEAYPFDSAPTVDASYYRRWDILGNSFKGIDLWTYRDHMNEHCPIGNFESGRKNYVKHKNLGDSKINPNVTHGRDSIVQYINGQFSISPIISSKKYGSAEIIKCIMPELVSLPITPGISYIVPKGILILGSSSNNSGSAISGGLYLVNTEVIYGGNGGDNINGYYGDDYFIGGNGHDLLDGGNGNDTYVFYKGQGVDTIFDISGNDTIKLYGFTMDDHISYDYDSKKDYILVKNNGETIIEINKNRSTNPINSLVVEKMDGTDIVSSQKLQDWNVWKNVKSYKIACPVSVEIYNAAGEKVFTIEDKTEIAEHKEFGNFYAAFNEEAGEYEKLVQLPEGYSIKIVGTDVGTMSITVEETRETGEPIEYTAKEIPVELNEQFVINEEEKTITSDRGTIQMHDPNHVHSYQEIVLKEPTCVEVGIKGEKCATCGAVKENSNTEIPALGHVIKVIVDKPATYEETGIQHEECTICSWKGENVIIPAIERPVDPKPTITPIPTVTPEPTPLPEPPTEEEKASIEDALTESENYNKDNYSEETWKKFEDAVKAAEEGLKDSSLTKEEAEELLKNLQDALAEMGKVGIPNIKKVVVEGNKATVILDGKTDAAEGYDFVISKDKNCIITRNYRDIRKNITDTKATFSYVQRGYYYVYCHAWKKVDGKKAFGSWSTPYKFKVTATTVPTPKITSVTVKGRTVTVKIRQSKHAVGADVILGMKLYKDQYCTRPVDYGKMVKKNQNGTTITFTNVPRGTYYVGVHSYNKTGEGGRKVFSRWSEPKRIKVK